jgi:hypothetical protein
MKKNADGSFTMYLQANNPGKDEESNGSRRRTVDTLERRASEVNEMAELYRPKVTLRAATNAKRSPETGDLSLQVSMVAGTGFEF